MNAYLYYAGLAFVFLSPCLFGILSARFVLSEVSELEGYIKLVKFIKNEISSYMTKQEDIFSSFEDSYLEKNGFLPLLRSSPIDESSALKNALHSFEGRTLISKVCLSSLFNLGETLGKSSVKKQEDACDSCLAVLEKALPDIKNDALKKAKVYKTIGTAAGAVGVILFL